MQTQKELDKVLQLVGFTVGVEKFAIDISEVHEINRFEQINRIPDLPNHVLGVIDLRGMVIPVINLAEKLGTENKNITKDTRIIVVGFNGEKIGILVDSVSEVLRVSANSIEKPPSIIQSVNAEYISGIIRNNNHLTVLLDLPRLFKDYIPLLTDEHSIRPEENNPPLLKGERGELSRGMGGFEGEKGELSGGEEGCSGAIDKIAEVTKAMSEGDFHHEIDGKLYGQIGEIAKYINTTVKKLQTVEPSIAQVSDKIPTASMQLSEITKATEQATHGVMSQVERVLDSQDSILNHLKDLEKGVGGSKTVEEIRQLVTEDKETLMDIITGLSFQDLTGQKIKTIIGLIEEVEKRILHLIVTFGLKSKETIGDDNPLRDLSDKTPIKQDLVDNILKEFGFDN